MKTQLCYTLEETAKRLNFSDTILLRLSQYFKIPANAYDTVGGMSFKGEPTFSEQDVRFFKLIKDRLLKGETLESLRKSPPLYPASGSGDANSGDYQTAPSVKSMAKPNASTPSVLSKNSAQTPFSNGINQNQSRVEQILSKTPAPSKTASIKKPQQKPSLDQGWEQSPKSKATPPASTGLREVRDDQALNHAAAKSFEQYKKNSSGLGLRRVFQRLLNDIGVSSMSESDVAALDENSYAEEARPQFLEDYFAKPIHYDHTSFSTHIQPSPSVVQPVSQGSSQGNLSKPKMPFANQKLPQSFIANPLDLEAFGTGETSPFRRLDPRLSQAAERLKKYATRQEHEA